MGGEVAGGGWGVGKVVKANGQGVVLAVGVAVPNGTDLSPDSRFQWARALSTAKTPTRISQIARILHVRIRGIREIRVASCSRNHLKLHMLCLKLVPFVSVPLFLGAPGTFNGSLGRRMGQ